MKRGRCQTMTHDYKRNGVTTLFAAMSTLDGNVIGQCMTKHRHQEWLRFLRQIDRSTPKDKELHLIADNYRRLSNYLSRDLKLLALIRLSESVLD